jgi:hypothetical protein
MDRIKRNKVVEQCMDLITAEPAEFGDVLVMVDLLAANLLMAAAGNNVKHFEAAVAIHALHIMEYRKTMKSEMEKHYGPDNDTH